MGYHHPHGFLGFESFGEVSIWFVQATWDHDVDDFPSLLDIVLELLESGLFNLIRLPSTVVVVVVVVVTV